MKSNLIITFKQTHKMFLKQVNRVFNPKSIISRSFSYSQLKCYSTALINLRSRKMLKVAGEDAPDFLQGLITNDMRHFEDNAKVIYTMFLNNKGRVLYDSLIYKWDKPTTFLLECERSIAHLLMKHLNLFKLKRKVEFTDVGDKYNVWALLAVPHNAFSKTTYEPQNPINIIKDPRLPELGYRIISTNEVSRQDLCKLFGEDITEKEEDVYRYVRYKLGVGEGPDELHPGTCFPLEANCDYLHGVSFHKGCYIGQELTARIHHTGVVRKRLMPIKFLDSVEEYIDKDEPITVGGKTKTKIGKLTGFIHDYGLGLIKIKNALEAENVNVLKYKAEVIKPMWWPQEAPKELAN